MTLVRWPQDERPREKWLNRGPESLSDAELLALFLGTGRRGCSAVDLGRELLTAHGGLRGVLDASPQSLAASPGLGNARSLQLKAALELGRRYLEHTLIREPAFPDAGSVGQFLKARLRCQEREIFAVLFLDHRHRLISYRELFQGTLDSAAVYPREVVKEALRQNAAAVILSHNHPSGSPEPSQADRAITWRLRDALALVDIRVLDHIVVGEGAVVSMAGRGWL